MSQAQILWEATEGNELVKPGKKEVWGNILPGTTQQSRCIYKQQSNVRPFLF